jgi:hypothetical protein
MKQFSIILLSLCAFSIAKAQDGRHISLNFDLEKNAWAMDGGSTVDAGVNFIDLQYFHYGDRFDNDVLFDVNISGFLSSIQGNNYQFSSDDSLQITNTNIVSLNALHLFGYNDIRFGFLWGIDFMAKYLSVGAEPGGWESDRDPGSISGLGIPLGVGGEAWLLNEKLIIDYKLAYYVVYNSGYAAAAGKTFQSQGIQSKIRGRFYLNDSFFASGQLFYENLSFEPTPEDINDPSGNTSTTRFMIGLGYQFY